MSQSRQLAVIMFTDIVGYTALMGHDEEKAFHILNKNRELQRPIIEEFNGRWIKELGDGILASFHTVSDAVNAAIKIQEACHEANDFQLRIGIHLGEVIFENEDVFGDGVNIASRIQAIARPGSIYISEPVHHNISNKKEIITRFIREEKLKNVNEPVKIHEVVTPHDKPFPTENKKTKPWTGKKPAKRLIIAGSIIILGMWIFGYLLTHFLNKKLDPPTNKWVAVLPFRLISGDSSMEWLSDGFTEELTSSIAGISDLKVKSPTTMMQYKNSKKGIRQISEELDVSNIIEGRLQQEGNSIIINASLINPATEEILHNFKFKKDASEIKSVYSEVAQQVADMLNASITSDEKRRLEHVEKVDPDLYNLYLQGLRYARQFNYQSEQAAIKIFDAAIKKDSNYAPVLAGKAFAIMGLAAWNASVNRDEALKQIDPLIAKSIAIDSNISLAYSAKGWTEMILKWDLRNSEIHFLKANSLDPSDDIAISGLIFKNMYSGNPKAAYKMWEIGKAISPNSWWIDAGHGMNLYFLGEMPQAIQFCKDGIEKYDHILFYDKLGWIYDLTNHQKEAIGILEEEITRFRIRPASSLAWLASSYYKDGQKDKAAEILHELENLVNLNTPNVTIYTAAAYASIGEKEKAFHFLDKAYEMHDADMIWLKMEPHFISLHNEIRYQEMLKKVGF